MSHMKVFLVAVASALAFADNPPSFVINWGANQPTGVAADRQGNVYVANNADRRILKFDTTGHFVTGWGSSGSGNGQFINPQGLATDLAGNVYVSDYSANRIQKFDGTGAYITQWGATGSGPGLFNQPFGLAADSVGNLYVCDQNNSRIQKFTSAGGYLAQWATAGGCAGVAVDSSGNVYVSNGSSLIQKFSNTGALLLQWGSPGSGNGQFEHALGVAVDGSGSVFVADFNNSRLQKFSSTGAYLTQLALQQPEFLAIDAAGYIYVSQTFSNRIQKLLTTLGHFQTLDHSTGQAYILSGINHNGQITGWYFPIPLLDPLWTPTTEGRGFILSGGALLALPGVLSPTIYNYARGLNNNGIVVGSFALSEDRGYIYRTATGRYTVFDAPGDTATVISGVNEIGEMVGTYNELSNAPLTHGFMRFGLEFWNLDFPGAFSTNANGICGTYGGSTTRVVGSFRQSPGGPSHGFFWSISGFVPIDVPSATSTSAAGIAASISNESVRIVGTYTDAGGKTHGFRRDGLFGVFTPIDFPDAVGTYPRGINDLGQIVGYYSDPSGRWHGFRYDPN